jgi:hypothetical protein
MQGPELMTCGPYRPIRLVAYSARISSVDLAALVSEDHAPTISGVVAVEGDSNHIDHVRVRLTHPNDGSVIYEEIIWLEPTEVKNVSSATAQWDVTGKVELWWPAGHGEQQLYELSVDLIDKVGGLAWKDSVQLTPRCRAPMSSKPTAKRSGSAGSSWCKTLSRTQISTERARRSTSE